MEASAEEEEPPAEEESSNSENSPAEVAQVKFSGEEEQAAVTGTGTVVPAEEVALVGTSVEVAEEGSSVEGGSTGQGNSATEVAQAESAGEEEQASNTGTATSDGAPSAGQPVSSTVGSDRAADAETTASSLPDTGGLSLLPSLAALLLAGAGILGLLTKRLRNS